jgi:uracil-DNA glycosylase
MPGSVRMGDGPPGARIMLVGEAWGETEEKTGVPFSGTSGMELNRMLHEAGILRNECYVTNVVNARPQYNDITKWIPEDKKSITGRMVVLRDKYVDPIVKEGFIMLIKEIELVKPTVIIALGGTALWALTGNSSIVKWRGSLLDVDTEEMKKCL